MRLARVLAPPIRGGTAPPHDGEPRPLLPLQAHDWTSQSAQDFLSWPISLSILKMPDYTSLSLSQVVTDIILKENGTTTEI